MDKGVTEKELVKLARRRDSAAWGKLVSGHQEPAFRLAYLLLGDPDDAEDVAQEAFIRAWQALDRFDADRPLRPWLLRIVSNLARNRRRSIGRYLAAVARFAQENPDASHITQDTFSEEDSAALWQALQKVKLNYRAVIYLRYFLDLSEAEMAEVLDVAQGTIKSRLHRALKQLREIIEQDYEYLKE